MSCRSNSGPVPDCSSRRTLIETWSRCRFVFCFISGNTQIFTIVLLYAKIVEEQTKMKKEKRRDRHGRGTDMLLSSMRHLLQECLFLRNLIKWSNDLKLFAFRSQRRITRSIRDNHLITSCFSSLDLWCKKGVYMLSDQPISLLTHLWYCHWQTGFGWDPCLAPEQYSCMILFQPSNRWKCQSSLRNTGFMWIKGLLFSLSPQGKGNIRTLERSPLSEWPTSSFWARTLPDE